MKEVAIEHEFLQEPDEYYECDDELPDEGLLPSSHEDEPWIKVSNPAREPPTGWEGKWLIFLEASRVDAVWAVIRRETMANKLGVSAKVSTAYSPGDTRVICVYTCDYRDEQDVRRVRELLFELGWHDPLPYKTDHQTRAGVRGSLFRY